MAYKAEVVADSISPEGVRLTTMLLEYPRFIHAEMLRHRVMSHAVASSRAIPPEQMIERVATDPFVPETFNARVKGMGVGDPLAVKEIEAARAAWIRGRNAAIREARELLHLNVDKSRINRLLEPFMWLHDIVTATEWDNFFALRDHPAAQPEFQILARKMREAREASQPDPLLYGEWHLPFLTGSEEIDLAEARRASGGATSELVKQYKLVSSRRVARVSFDKHTDSELWSESMSKAIELVNMAHFSPFEVVARPFTQDEWAVVRHAQNVYAQMVEVPLETRRAWINQAAFVGNLRGWVQFRKEFANEHNYGLASAGRS